MTFKSEVYTINRFIILIIDILSELQKQMNPQDQTNMYMMNNMNVYIQ
jgi:hypothetical protein